MTSREDTANSHNQRKVSEPTAQVSLRIRTEFIRDLSHR